MAYDEGLAQLLREDWSELSDLREQPMFGGLCFMWRGNMLGGVGPKGGLMRVGEAQMPKALALPGTGPMEMGKRTMAGFVRVAPDAMSDDATRAPLVAMATEFCGSLPPK